VDDRIVLLNNECIGRMILLQTREEIRLADLAILPQYRQRGIGTALIGQLQTESLMSNRPVRLHVARFDRASRLYQRLGFYKIDVEGPYPFRMDQTIRSFTMRHARLNPTFSVRSAARRGEILRG
jgi:ribosomal protein S18 acetylase RimI-like enzyme